MTDKLKDQPIAVHCADCGDSKIVKMRHIEFCEWSVDESCDNEGTLHKANTNELIALVCKHIMEVEG